MNRLLLLPLILPALATAAPQAVLRWQADAASPAPEPFAATILQGEIIGLECRLRGARIPISATASFLWQTNGMADAWWETNATVTASNGTVRADWTPAMDCGASSYSFFLRVSAPGSSLYRAYGVLRMRASPGAAPNALPIPRQSLDFASVEVANAPYYAKAEVDDALTAKQDALTFDSTPTAGSTNPVTSGGVKTALTNYYTKGETENRLYSYVGKTSGTSGSVLVSNGNGGMSASSVQLSDLEGKVDEEDGHAKNLALVSNGGNTAIQFGRSDGRHLYFGGYGASGFSPSFGYEFPTKSGTFALTSDVPGVVAPDAAHADTGKAADSLATKTALDGKASLSDLSPDWQTVNAPGAAVTITHNGRTPQRIVKAPSGALAITISSASPSATEMSIEGATSVTFAATGGATVRVGGGVFRPGLENHFSIRKSFDGSIIINWLYAL